MKARARKLTKRNVDILVYRDDERLSDHLEAIIDQRGIKDVLEALSEVCSDKANHLLESWQDHYSASHWNVLSVHLQQLGVRFSGR
jgi:hypothetical protein